MSPSSRNPALLAAAITLFGCSDATQPVRPTPLLEAVTANSGSDWTAITSCGSAIIAPGNYYLATDLVNCPANGITIAASNVVLILNGKTITGQAAARRTDSGDGISVGRGVVDGVHSVKIRGPGTISGFWGAIFFEQVLSSEVKGVTLTGSIFGFPINAGHRANQGNNRSRFNHIVSNRVVQNLGHGFSLNGADDNQIWFNEITGNEEGWGILLFIAERNDVNGNTASGNLVGIGAEEGSQEPSSLGNVIKKNVALGNLAFDLLDLWGDCVHNTWQQNQYGTKSPACIQ
jgi:nitrous oxidase accessory protein NosD